MENSETNVEESNIGLAISDDELSYVENLINSTMVDIEYKNTKLNKTTRKQEYSVSRTYSGPDMDVLRSLATFDQAAWLIVQKLLYAYKNLKG